MAVTRTSEILREAWELRFRQRNREARTLLDEVDHSGLSRESRLDAELLRVSLLRAENELEKSNELLASLEPEAMSDRARVPFQYYLQKALNLFKADDFAVSLEYFLLADRHAPSSVHRVVCLMNVRTCMDNLGLPWSGVLAELERELPKAKRKESAFVQAVESQLRLVRFIDAYREMKFAPMFEARAPAEFDQAEYLRLYVSRLPYVRSDWRTDESLELLARTESFHLKAYRFGTLTFWKDIGAKELVETSQLVDRLYLWTWAWLAEPSEKRRQDLASCLEAIDFSKALKQMTWEDTQMMRNALGWIAIFQPKLAPWISRYLETIPKAELQPFPVFALEAKWLEAVRVNDGAAMKQLAKTQSSKRQAKATPTGGGSAHIDFASVITHVVQSRTSMLAAVPRASVLVDERTNEIVRGKSRTQSEPLVRLVRALVDRKSLGFDEVLWLGFEIAPYDSSVHAPKIYNLIARLKSLLPKTVKLSTKQGALYLSGSVRGLDFVTIAPHERAILTSGVDFTRKPVPQLTRSVRTVHPRQLVAFVDRGQEWTRAQLQTLLKTSKAGTQRWIQKWEAQGFVQRHGQGKSSTYRIELARHLRLSDSI